MKFFILLLALVCVALSAPTPPNPAETYQAAITTTIRDSRSTRSGKGVWAADSAYNRGLETYQFAVAEDDVFELERYDLGYAYFEGVDRETNKTECRSFKISGKLPKQWGWLANASFIGVINNTNAWRSTLGYANVTLGVSLTDPDTPVWLERNARDELSTKYVFDSWSTNSPSASVFAVPSICPSSKSKSNQTSACIARDTVISRAKVWVANKVPYNQGATYQGYREDCSGYVSMAWDSSQPGHTTQTLDEIASPISKEELQPGDVLLYAAEHVVLFGGWTDSAKSEYTAFEETKPGEGTVTRPTPYPYWYSQSDFLPYKFNNIC